MQGSGTRLVDTEKFVILLVAMVANLLGCQFIAKPVQPMAASSDMGVKFTITSPHLRTAGKNVNTHQEGQMKQGFCSRVSPKFVIKLHLS